jgi:hypothetical protein
MDRLMGIAAFAEHVLANHGSLVFVVSSRRDRPMQRLAHLVGTGKVREADSIVGTIDYEIQVWPQAGGGQRAEGVLLGDAAILMQVSMANRTLSLDLETGDNVEIVITRATQDVVEFLVNGPIAAL